MSNYLPEKGNASALKNYAFIDTLRCIAMMSVVYEHCILLNFQRYDVLHHTIMQTVFVNIGKFGTVLFFVLAGFLINYKFCENTPGGYLKNRVQSTWKPWFVWMIVYFILLVVKDGVMLNKGNAFGNDPIGFIKNTFIHTLTFSNYWFIPNFFICITTLLLLRRYLYSKWLGLVLGVLSFMYSLNLYFNWFVSDHTVAFAGFIFYLWLGVQMNRHYDQFTAWIRSRKLIWLSVITLLLFALSCAESYLLLNIGTETPFNTLRISNILFSLSMFILLFRIGQIDFITRLNPRNTTFGMYLIHPLIVSFIVPFIFIPFGLKGAAALDLHPGHVVLIGWMRFIITYLFTYLIILGINRSGFYWSIGQSKKGKATKELYPAAMYVKAE